MTNELVQYTIPDVERMAQAIAKSGLFGVKSPEQAFALMLVAQAEGRHPAEAARDYHVINNKPSKTADAMLRDFLQAGGRVEWHTLTDEKADATLSHPAGGSVRIDWDMARAKKAGITGNPTWTKYPRAMLRARVISEGVRTVYPGATSGFYEENEVRAFTEEQPMKDVTPKKDMVDELREKMKEAEKASEPTADDYIADFADASMEELQHKWKAAQKQFKDSTEFARIHAAKEKRKKELTSQVLAGDTLPDEQVA